MNASVFPFNIRRLFATASITACACLASGCGGGGWSDVETTFVDFSRLSDAFGSYASDCGKRGKAAGDYKKVTATLSAGNGDSAVAVVHYQSFGGDLSCSPASIQYDITGTFDVQLLAQTKEIPKTADHLYSGTARVAEARLQGVRIAKGAFSGRIPSTGTVTKVGYRKDGSRLYFLSGRRAGDGLGAYFSDLAMKKIS